MKASTLATLSRRQFVCAGAALVAALGFGLGRLGASSALAADKAASAGADAPAVDFAGPFVVGFDQDFPPYGYVDDKGQFAGFDLDLARAVCDVEGWEVKLEPIAWDAKDALLNSGQITCIWNGFTIEGREGDYAFTDPYMENRQVVVVRADSGIADLAGLSGKVVLTQTDSAALGLLSEGGTQEALGKTFSELQTIGDYNTAFMMLETGAVDAVAIDYPVAVYQIGDKTDAFTILSEPLNSEHYGVGFAKGNEALAARVEYDLKQLDAEGKVKELCDKYADQGVSYDAWCLGKDVDGEAAGSSAVDKAASSAKDASAKADKK